MSPHDPGDEDKNAWVQPMMTPIEKIPLDASSDHIREQIASRREILTKVGDVHGSDLEREIDTLMNRLLRRDA